MAWGGKCSWIFFRTFFLLTKDVKFLMIGDGPIYGELVQKAKTLAFGMLSDLQGLYRMKKILPILRQWILLFNLEHLVTHVQ